MTVEELRQSLSATELPPGLSHALDGLWWDATGELDAGTRIRSAGRRIVGSRLP